ncbi:TPA: hypothetical protein P2I16_001619 [Aeromonas salmonicida]|nr:hypothetical protein [Aeromonas salmonicida]
MKNADMPAMPTVTYDHSAAMNGFAVTVTDLPGLTKLETVALHLMAALIGKTDSRYEPKHAAEDAFQIADAYFAVLEARNDQ